MMRMSFEHRMWLLDMVADLGLQPRLAKIRAKTAEQEWEVVARLVSEHLDARNKKGPR